MLDLGILAAAKHSKPVYLPRDLLERLYERFPLANPKGTRITAVSQFEDYAPPGLAEGTRSACVRNGVAVAGLRPRP